MDAEKIRKVEDEINGLASSDFGEMDALITILCTDGRTAMAAKGRSDVIAVAIANEAKHDKIFRLLLENVVDFLNREYPKHLE